MAIIKPFRGIRYNQERIPDLSCVVSQPHDRVRHGLQDRYYALSPYNVARLIKGRQTSGNGRVVDVAARARQDLDAWLDEGVLRQEDRPALYVLQQQFPLADGSVRRRAALIAALQLTPFEEGVVLPHERTLAKSMTSRISLLRATAVNFGCVFMLYPEGGINELLEPVMEAQPPAELQELFENEVVQRFWTVTDPEVIAAVTEAMAPRRNLIIADGHHRYETSLAHRKEMQALHPDAPADAGFNYRLVALVSMDDPGLVILPTHRLIRKHTGISGEDVRAQAAQFFEVTPVAGVDAL